MTLQLFAPCPVEMQCECWEVRHEIYCVKLGWEPTAQDEQDARSLHVLVQEDGKPVATTRVTPLTLNARVAELGRTAMSDSCKDRARARALLVEGVKQIVRQLKIEHCISFMEDRMIRLERRYGFVWEKVGPTVEHRGLRSFAYMRAPE